MSSSRKPQTSAEDFIRVWQSAKDVAEVCAKLGYSDKLGACQNASRLRRRGVKLKRFPESPPLDIDKLNRIAAEHLSE